MILSDKIKYVVCPGYVTSLNDRQRHYINFDQLVKLYGVNRDECVEWKHRLWDGRKAPRKIMFLYPRSSGDYTLPEPS